MRIIVLKPAATRLHCCGPLLRWDPVGPCLLQNPKERITLPKMMKHPWVTRRGSWPLRSMKEMVRSGEDLDEPVPDLMNTFHVLDVPRQVSKRSVSGSAQSVHSVQGSAEALRCWSCLFGLNGCAWPRTAATKPM